MRIIVFITTVLIQLTIAVVGFFMLILGLNGFSEAEATPGIIFYKVLSVMSALGLGIASALLAKRLVRRQGFGSFWAATTAVASVAVVGGGIVVGGFFVALILTTFMHEWK